MFTFHQVLASVPVGSLIIWRACLPYIIPIESLWKKNVYARSCIGKVTCSVVRYTHAKPQPFINCLRISCEVTRAGVRKDTRKFDVFRNSLYLPLKMDSLPAGHVLTKFWGCRDVCVICYSVPRATDVLDSHTNLLGRYVEPMKCPEPLKNRNSLKKIHGNSSHRILCFWISSAYYYNPLYFTLPIGY